MSKYFKQPAITVKGRQAVAKAIGNNETITFTRVVVGTGRHEGLLSTNSKMASEKMSLSAMQKFGPQGASYTIVGRLDNTSVEEEFTITEIGVFVKAGNNPEVMYMYTTAEEGDTIPSRRDAILVRDYEFNVRVSNNETINITYTTMTSTLATRRELEILQETVNNHESLFYQDTNGKALEGRVGEAEKSLTTHVENKNNPHGVTKAQVGLGNVDNVKQASKAEFDTHTANTTAHVTAQERNTWNAKANSGDLTGHTGNKNNPHGVTKAQVGLGNVTNVEQASKEAFNSHTTNAKVHISDSERANWNSKANGSHTHPTSQINGLDTKLAGYDGHVGSKSNPHGVTKSQIGLGNVSNVLQAPKTDFDALKGRYDKEVNALLQSRINTGSAASRYNCPKGTDLATWLKGSTVPVGLYVVKDDNTNRLLRVVKQDANNIYCDSILGDGHYLFVIHNGQSTGWQQDGPISGENSNGWWTKFPDGTLICWGLPRLDYGSATYSGTKTITFPMAFSKNPGISVTIYLEPASETYRRLPGVNLVGQTIRNFSFTVGDNSGGRQGSYMWAYYIAIGRWK